jgi:adenylate cyclase
MRNPNPERRLAAVLMADVEGYTRLMGGDEAGIYACLKAIRREIIDPSVKRHNGRLVKSTGDGVLIEFPSAVEAVACAVEVQRARHRQLNGFYSLCGGFWPAAGHVLSMA